MMKIERGKSKEIVFESLFQIFLLVMGVVAFSYFIGDLSNKVEAQVIEKDIENYVCCEKTKTNAFCQNTYEENCNTNFKIGPKTQRCEYTDFCRLGCCYDSKEGICAQSTPRRVCEERNGTFIEDKNCDVPQCKLACCIFGERTFYSTKKQCENYENFFGKAEFKTGITNEYDCLQYARNKVEKGACIIDREFDRNCKFVTKEECKKLRGDFYNGYLCSNPELETGCIKQHHTGCVVGKDEVYWFDSCGNPENIYDANKERSYNNGRVLPKELSCSISKSGESFCGNCDYLQGSKCGLYREGIDKKPETGGYVCRNLDCVNIGRKNGESWCEYDSNIGNGADAVGSRHWRHMCFEGEEIIEGCADYRNEICMEGVQNIGDLKLNFGVCRVNRWQGCTLYAEESSCNDFENGDCMWINQITGSGKPSGMCVPKYPPGLKFWEKNFNFGGAYDVCSRGSDAGAVIWEVDIFGDKTCKKGCSYKETSWSEPKWEACRRLGDCGSRVNIAGKYAGSYGWEIDGKNKVVVSDAEKRALALSAPKPFKEKLNKSPTMLIGLLKFILAPFLWILEDLKSVKGDTLASSAVVSNPGVVGPGSNVIPILGKGATVAGVYLLIMTIFTKLTDYQVSSTALYTGAALEFLAGVVIAAICSFPPGVGCIIGIVGAVLVLLVEIGISYKQEIQYVKFYCGPWIAPAGGKDCEKFNDLPEPISEYRCKSLGRACGVINRGTNKEKCVDLNPGDVSPPVISPYVINGSFKWELTKNGHRIIKENSKNGCIDSFEKFYVGITTDEFSSCKLDTKITSDFKSMNNFFGGDSLMKKEHFQDIRMPGPKQVQDYINYLRMQGINASIEQMPSNNQILFIRCEDAHGNYNLKEYTIEFCLNPEPDLTPPIIEITYPENRGGVKFGIENINVTFLINEPSDCRWDFIDKDYEDMKNQMKCVTNLKEINQDMLYPCTTELKINPNDDNVFYVRCKDQPWLNESERNVNRQSYEYILKGSKPLEIKSIDVNEKEIVTNKILYPLDITVLTEGGFSGVHVCFYKLEKGLDIRFFETASKIHKQQLNFIPGEHLIQISCTDSVGNTDSKNASFKIISDNFPPKVTRAYYNFEKLIVETDEEALCKYDYNCEFDFEESNNTFSGLQRIHQIEWEANKDYYIKCKDNLGNVNEDCAIIVKTYGV